MMPPPAGTAKNWAAYRARFVERERIAVVAQRLKPPHGIKVSFDTRSGEVLLRRLSHPLHLSPHSRIDAINFDRRASIPHQQASPRFTSDSRCTVPDSA